VQLVELQDASGTLEAAGVVLVAISYDSVDTLSAFAEKRGITVPLLSDEGSHVIRELGLLNEHLAEQAAVYGLTPRDDQHGVAYPGTFVLDEHGIVLEKYFEQSYRVRPTARMVEEYAITATDEIPTSAVRASNDGLEVGAWTDAPTYHPYQQVRVHLNLSMTPDLHVYAAPAPDGYTPLRIHVESLDGLTVGELQLPTPRPFTIEGLDESFVVFEGTVRGMLPLMFTSNLGPTLLQIRLDYQACTATTCLPPSYVSFEVALTGLDVIRD